MRKFYWKNESEERYSPFWVLTDGDKWYGTVTLEGSGTLGPVLIGNLLNPYIERSELNETDMNNDVLDFVLCGIDIGFEDDNQNYRSGIAKMKKKLMEEFPKSKEFWLDKLDKFYNSRGDEEDAL